MRYKITEGASELFFRFGVQRVRLPEIADHVGITTRTIYNYFENKEQLVEEVNRHNIGILSDRLQEVIEGSEASFFVKLENCAQILSDEMTHRDLRIGDLLIRKPRIDSNAETLLIQEQLLAMGERLISMGKDEGLVLPETSSGILLYLLITALYGLMEMRKSGIIDSFPVNNFGNAFHMVVHGILTDKGRREFPLRFA